MYRLQCGNLSQSLHAEWNSEARLLDAPKRDIGANGRSESAQGLPLLAREQPRKFFCIFTDTHGDPPAIFLPLCVLATAPA
jgi:hypothetical protein